MTALERFEAGQVQAAADLRTTGEAVRVPLDQLGPGPKVRREHVDLDHVNALVEADGNWPPILVCRADWGRPFRVLDGNHRVAAAGRMGRVGLHVIVLDVDVKSPEAVEAAVKANIEHGLPLTLAERKSLAQRFVKDTEWGDRRVAEACGLTHRSVASMRPKSTRATGESAPLARSGDDGLRTGKDGRRRPASPAVAAERREAAAREIEAKPAASDREVAKRVGISPRTVAEVRRRNAAGQDPSRPRLRAVPDPEPERPAQTAGPKVSVGDVVTLVPNHWGAEQACQRSNATREFGRFMDRFTRWHDKSFDHWVKAVGDGCPVELRKEAAELAGWMAGWWKDYAARLSAAPAPTEVE